MWRQTAQSRDKHSRVALPAGSQQVWSVQAERLRQSTGSRARGSPVRRDKNPLCAMELQGALLQKSCPAV